MKRERGREGVRGKEVRRERGRDKRGGEGRRKRMSL